MTSTSLALNGIDGSSGEYLLDNLTSEAIVRVARGQRLEPGDLKDVRIRRSLDEGRQDHFGLVEGLDPKDLAQSGWGIIFPSSLDRKQRDELREALSPLLEHRREQAAGKVEHYYREFLDSDGHRPSESKQDFLKRFGRGAGPADPEKVPYYLLIVGDPEQIPYSFQYQLDVQYAVGRIYFDSSEDYYRYARSVVEAESKRYTLPRRAAFFGPANEDDRATNLSAKHLVQALADLMAQDQPDWKIETLLKEQAFKSRLSDLLRSPKSPALLFTASHGMAFPSGNSRQLPHQGALLCQDWPGPKMHKGRIPEEFYFSGDDLERESNVFGLMAFLFACYGAGTPKMDNFYRAAYSDQKSIAPRSFLARLPQRLLSHPGGGALAVVGHVDRAWGYSFYWDGAGRDLAVFESAVKRLADGYPIGAALEYFNGRYAELSTDLTSELDETTPEIQDEVKIAGLWTSNNDARNYAVIGDPAARLLVGETATAQGERPIFEISSPPLLQKDTEIPPTSPVVNPELALASAPEVQVDLPQPAVVNSDLSGAYSQSGDDPGSPLQDFINKLSTYLDTALDGTASIQVATYTSENLDEVKYENGRFTGARLRALTEIQIGGDTLLCLPEGEEGSEAALWDFHREMVQQAQASRTELLRVAVSAASGLGYLLKA